MFEMVCLMAGMILVLITLCLWFTIRKEPCHPAFGWFSCKQGKCSTCISKRGGTFRATKITTITTQKLDD